MFYAKADSIDDLMRIIFKRLLSKNSNNFRVKSRKGLSTEIFGALIELRNPRARLSRSRSRSKIYSAIGELIWYLSASNSVEFIDYYLSGYHKFSDDGVTANGAYGPRIFCKERAISQQSVSDEWQRIINKLRAGNGTRNAIIQIFSNRDALNDSKDVPCTCTLQFLIRNNRLHMHTHMRSNDAFRGLPHDLFSFTMFQEIAARELGFEIGLYKHSVTSLHLYDDDAENQSRTLAQRYLEEDYFEATPMPPMPLGDPWPSIRQLVYAENMIRSGVIDFNPEHPMDPYWTDLVTLVKVYSQSRLDQNPNKLVELLREFSSPVYRLYVLDRIEKKRDGKQHMPDLFNYRRENA